MKLSMWEARQYFNQDGTTEIRFHLEDVPGDRVPATAKPVGGAGRCHIYFPSGEETQYKKILIQYIRDCIGEQRKIDEQLLASLEKEETK